MPIEAPAGAGRRAVRLALVLAASTAIAFGAGWTAPYVAVLLAAMLALPPGPPPGIGQLVLLSAVLAASSLWGLILGGLVAQVPVAGVVLMLAGVAGAAMLAQKPAAQILATLFILGNTLVAVVASYSSALAIGLVEVLLVGVLVAGLLVHLAHALLPECGPGSRPAPSAPAGDPRWIGIRAALIMALPVLLALANPGTFLMTLMKGAQLTQQVGATDARAMGRELVGSTAFAGVLAMALWWLLGLMPGLFLLCAGLAGAGLFIGARFHGAVTSRFDPTWWQNVLVTLLILIGPVLGDNPVGTDIQLQILKRTLIFLGLALYATLMVRLLDSARAQHGKGVHP
jgi:hypothetical protein